MNYIVAITGGIGSGKTTVANLFNQLGVPIIDTDLIARQMVAEGTSALADIVAHFGPQIQLADGRLNRKLLRQIIFNQPEEKQWLNNLLHPIIAHETKRQLAATDAPYVILVSPLLIETKEYKLANRILVVDVDPELQISRTVERDNITAELAQKMLDSQISRQERLSYADDIIANNTELEKLPSIVQNLHRRYITLAKLTSDYSG